MLNLTLPTENDRDDVLSFYNDIEKIGETCIGFRNYKDFNCWLAEMQNRHTGKHLPAGYVRENFYLCYESEKLVGVFSLKFELSQFLMQFGGHIGYAVRPVERNRGLATQMLNQGLNLARQFGFGRLLCICNEDNFASEKVILSNGGILENKLYDPDEKVFVKRYWFQL